MKTPHYSRQQGFSLVELMVGLTIGLFVLLGVLLVYTKWDGFSRTTSGKTDAQMGSTVAGYLLDMELRSAGVSIATAPDDSLGCTVAGFNSALPPPSTFSFPMIPVEIVDGGGAGAPDTIRVLFGNSSIRPAHVPITFSASSFEKTLAERGGVVAGDRLILAEGGVCELVEVTSSLGNPTPKTIEHRAATIYTSFYSPTPVTSTLNKAAGSMIGSVGLASAFSLGPSPQYNTWAITAPPAAPSLTVTRLFGGGLPQTVAEDVVNLQALYGIDTTVPLRPRSSYPAGLGTVSLWTPTIGAYAWQSVVAVHYAILVRSRQFEAPVYLPAAPTTPIWVTPTAPTWTGGGGAPIPFGMTDVSGAAMGTSDSNANDATNWKGYRYTVREGMIPLRNILWGQR